MKVKPLQIGNKIARLPLIQGGMGVGVSLSRLAGAVAKAGGVGIISTAQIGFEEPDFAEDSKTANLRCHETGIGKGKNHCTRCGWQMSGTGGIQHYGRYPRL